MSVPRHKRMTVKDKRNKTAGQFRRRVFGKHPSMRKKLGVKDYWELYNQRLSEQEGKCAICKTNKPGGRGTWHMDHNGKTGEIRGLLCCNCNLKLGWVEENLNGIAAYLRRWK